MLFGILSFLAASATAVICYVTDAFYSKMWMWLVPASFLGSFLILLVLCFLFLVIACALVDPEKPREKDSPGFRKMVLWYIDLVLTILPVKIHTHGMEKMPAGGRFLLVSNHIHDIDPGVLLHCFAKHDIAFVAKQEARHMFLLKKIIPKLLCLYINRENDREALKTILQAIKLIKEDTLSVGIFPEGRINPYRKLAHFRPGVFKIAQKAKAPIVVCTLQNTQYVLKNLPKLKRTHLHVHLLDVIPVEEVLASNTVELADRIYHMMADDLGEDLVLTPEEEESA